MSKNNYILCLKTVNPDMTAHDGFKWPKKGKVSCNDFKSTKKCGNGLHAIPWGVGDGSLLNLDSTAKWLVVKVKVEPLVEFDGKCKFKAGTVVHCGDRKSATDYLLANGAADKPVVGCFKIGGDGATLTGGYRATLTGGNKATLTGGDGAMLTSGNYATLTGGNGATLTGGNGATLTGGNGATLCWKIWNGNFYRLHIHSTSARTA